MIYTSVIVVIGGFVVIQLFTSVICATLGEVEKDVEKDVEMEMKRELQEAKRKSPRRRCRRR